jgi:GxxExxY protein
MEIDRRDATKRTPQRHRDKEILQILSHAGAVNEADPLTERIIGCAIEVHRHLGPGLLEGIYEAALCVELAHQGLAYQRQVPAPILYKGQAVGDYRLDLLIEDTVVVEIKSVSRHEPIFQAQVITYPKCSGKRLGLLINFNTRLLHDGVKRISL